MHSENNDQLNIVMLAASLPPMPAGGAEMQALRLARELQDKGHRVLFVTPGNDATNGRRVLNGIEVFYLHSFLSSLFKRFSVWKKKKKLSVIQIEYDDGKEITNQITKKVGWPTVVYYTIFYWHCLLFLWPRRRSFDVIHAHTMEWSAIVAARLGKVLKKQVVIKDSTMNGFQALDRFPSAIKIKERIVKQSNFIAMTKRIEENLKNAGIPAEKIVRIPNGISIPEEIKGYKRKGSLDHVLFVGNLYQQPAKGIDILLKAWVLVSERFPEYKLVIVGDGVTKEYIDFVFRLGISESVRFEGKQTSLRNYYTSSRLFVLPSRREGMSNALMEAMMWGLPCIATDISGNQDLIVHKSNGILVPVADINALAESICYMLSHPGKASDMGLRAKVTIEKCVTMNSIADKYIGFYRRLLSP